MKNRILQVSGHEVLLNEVIQNSNGKFIFDYVLNRSGSDFRFKKDQSDSKLFYITSYDENKFLWFKELLLILYKEKYPVIHFHISWPCAFLLPFMTFSKSKFIVHSHTVSSKKSLSSFFFKFFAKAIISFFSKVNLACSDEAGRDVFKKFIIFHNPVNYKRFKFSQSKRDLFRKNLNLSDQDKMCIHVGHYYHPKNQEFLIDLFKDTRLKEHKLFCFGDDLGNKKRLQKLISKNKLEKNILLFDSKQDIENYLNAADIFLMPSIFEGLGMAAIEAQVNGVKCILSDKIPKSTKISNDVTFLELNSKRRWVNAILKEEKVRSSSKNIDTKYDSKIASEVLLKIYKDMLCVV
jgi:glycosyltransferase involved in cell wall biosynthesis